MGCGSAGGCSTGGCSTGGGCSSGGCGCSSKEKMSTFDFLNDLMSPPSEKAELVEVSFKGGTRKEFFRNTENLEIYPGQYVAVQAQTGHDVGKISLTGLLAELQLKKKKIKPKTEYMKLYRIASENDIARLQEARKSEESALEKSREIAKGLGLEMKIGNVEVQGDSKKITFYYTAEGRVDFRELVKSYAKEFKAKIEMKQIGLRQEAAMVGGIGSCGRELCCSTWLSDFKMVSTTAARYQGLAINTARLSGQCGRLKCCLNFELDSYMEALSDFPKNLKRIKTHSGDARLIKTDILKKLLFFSYEKSLTVYTLSLDEVKEIVALNKAGKTAPDLVNTVTTTVETEEDKNDMESDLVGHININSLDKKKKKKKKRNNNNRKPGQAQGNAKPDNAPKNQKPAKKQNPQNKQGQGNQQKQGGENKGANNQQQGAKKRPNNKNRRPNNKQGNKPEGQAKQQNPQGQNNKPEGNKKRPNNRNRKPKNKGNQNNNENNA